ncbi:MAG: flagellar hook-length control protein FliK [Halieaceae bacterium]|nr:flagellar hook-length control protein FliK [Halieaceae bacterium]
MKNTIDNMFLSTSAADKGLDGIASIAGPEVDSDVQGFETTFRQALAAIDRSRSGKDLPKKLLEFDPEKLAGMALTQKKLSSDSTVLIGDADLSNQTVIAFAALQGMDAESLKTLFEKPILGDTEEMKDASENVKILTDNSLDEFVGMPPGSVEQTVRALEEQGLLPEIPIRGLKEKLDFEHISDGKINLKSHVDTGKKFSEAESMFQRADGQVENITNNWLNLRTGENAVNSTEVRGMASRKSADFPHNNTAIDAVDSELESVARESAVIGKDSVAISSNKGVKPGHSDLRTAPGVTSGIDTSESDLTRIDLKKLNISSAVDTNANSSPRPETGLKKEIEINSGFVNSSGPRHEKVQARSDSEQLLEFEEIQLTKDNKISSAPSSVLQATRTINDVVPQSQYVNSIGPAKPVIQQANLTGSVPVGEVAGLEVVGSSSDSNTTLDTLTQPKGLSPRVAVDDLPGKLTALVQQRIVNGLKVEGWRYQVHLHPEELGSVEIQMEMIDGRLEARILASNVAARDLLNEHLARLEESLQNGGIKESMVQVGLEQRQDSKKSFDSSDGNQENQTELADGDESEIDDAGQSNDGELDVFV